MQTLIDRNLDMMLVVAGEIITFANAASERCLGVAPADLIGRPLLPLIAPGDADALRHAIANARHSPRATASEPATTAVVEFCFGDGVSRRFLVSCVALPIAQGDAPVLISARWETDWGEHFRRIAEERELFFQMFENNPYGMGWTDREGRLQFMNRAERTVYSPTGGPPPDGYSVFTDPSLIALGIAERFRQVLEGTTIFEHEAWYDANEYYRANPHIEKPAHILDKLPVRCLRSVCFPVRSTAGAVTGIGIIHEEITVRKQAEQREREEREFVQAILATTGALIVVLAPDGIVMRANDAFYRATGFAPADVVERDAAATFLDAAARHRLQRLTQETRNASADAAPTPPTTRDGHWHTAAGPRLVVRVSENLVRADAGDVRFIVLSALDITEQRALEMQLQHAGKLGLLGKMAAGVVHEISRPLAILSARMQNLREDGATANLGDDFDFIEGQINRLIRIGQTLAEFTRQRTPQTGELPVAPVALHRVVADALAILRFDRRAKRIALVNDVPADLPTIIGKFEQLQQVMINVGLNAFDAMPDGGEIRVDAGVEQDAEQGRASIHWRICDTGHGIPADHLAEIFRPFFSTRSGGHGMGLGLALCRTYISTHGGTIDAASTPGVGTTISIRLPVTVSVPT